MKQRKINEEDRLKDALDENMDYLKAIGSRGYENLSGDDSRIMVDTNYLISIGTSGQITAMRHFIR